MKTIKDYFSDIVNMPKLDEESNLSHNEVYTAGFDKSRDTAALAIFTTKLIGFVQYKKEHYETEDEYIEKIKKSLAKLLKEYTFKTLSYEESEEGQLDELFKELKNENEDLEVEIKKL